MRRWAGIAGAAGLAATLSGAAFADLPEPCNRTAISVYFAEGAHRPTEEAAAVLARTGRVLSGCETDRVSVVARFSPSGGKVALDLALARLAEVAQALVRDGVDIGRIRLAAMPSNADGDAAGPGRVDLWTGHAAPPPRSRPDPPEGSDA
jgi:hypothetical protein